VIIRLHFLIELILGTVKILSALNKDASQRENERTLSRKDKHRTMIYVEL